MFAYCNNTPVNASDPTGHVLESDYQQKNYDEQLGVVASGYAAFALTTLIYHAAYYTTQFLNKQIQEVYQYSKTVFDYSSNRYSNHQPHVHHVIPKGKYSNRNRETQQQLQYMRGLLEEVGISINDPENLIVLSCGSHCSIHTNEYFDGIYTIMLTAERGNRNSVRLALFFARIYAGSFDQYPRGY